MRGLSHPSVDTAFGVLDDLAFLLRVVAGCWRGNFDRYLPRSARNLVFTLRDKRNEWAHNRAVQPHNAPVHAERCPHPLKWVASPGVKL